jgi:hypothetical protein
MCAFQLLNEWKTRDDLYSKAVCYTPVSCSSAWQNNMHHSRLGCFYITFVLLLLLFHRKITYVFLNFHGSQLLDVHHCPSVLSLLFSILIVRKRSKVFFSDCCFSLLAMHRIWRTIQVLLSKLIILCFSSPFSLWYAPAYSPPFLDGSW